MDLRKKEDLLAIQEELRVIDQKRLAQFPIRVRKVKRLRRQITELNRALRREKESAIYWHEWYQKSAEQTKEALVVVRDCRVLTDRWQKLYESADSRATTWQRMTGVMGMIGAGVGMAVGIAITLLLT